MQAEELKGPFFACGFSGRKLKILSAFLAGDHIRPVDSGNALPEDSVLFIWGSFPLPAECPDTAQVVRVEDGFLRSVGLGADLISPVSWVLDRTGIYYDSTHPSDLELILQMTVFDSAILRRAGLLREKLVDSGLTKYNVGSGGWIRPVGSDQRVILVPGQVESDASIYYGAPGIRTNCGLLQAVRQTHPKAYIIYKPHPDVLAGMRRKGEGEGQVAQWCNEVVAHAPMGELLLQVDEVHTMTSLTGFEALLRGKNVCCYGQPFYAGWGLTNDSIPLLRRTRRLSLDELVAGALLLYPTYISRETGRRTTAEQALEELLEWRTSQGGKDTLWRRLSRVFIRRVTGVR